MESMTQRARKPYRVLGGGYPSEGVKALWAFHTRILPCLAVLVCIFFLRPFRCLRPNIVPIRLPNLVQDENSGKDFLTTGCRLLVYVSRAGLVNGYCLAPCVRLSL